MNNNGLELTTLTKVIKGLLVTLLALLVMTIFATYSTHKMGSDIDYLVNSDMQIKANQIIDAAYGIENELTDGWSEGFITTSQDYCNEVFTTEELRVEFGIINDNNVDSCNIIEDYLNLK